MIATETSKRDGAMLAWLLLCFSFDALLAVGIMHRMWSRVMERTLFALLCAIVCGGIFFWFKAMYHWSRAKGYSSWVASVGVLGFPLALLVLAILRDRRVPVSDPRNVISCPTCQASINLADYRDDVDPIRCLCCRTEITRMKRLGD